VELWLLLLLLILAWHATLWVVLCKASWRELEGLLVLTVGISVLIDSIGREVTSGYRSISWVTRLSIRIGWELKVLVHLYIVISHV
jgi:hypothetical protein